MVKNKYHIDQDVTQCPLEVTDGFVKFPMTSLGRLDEVRSLSLSEPVMLICTCKLGSGNRNIDAMKFDLFNYQVDDGSWRQLLFLRFL